MIDLPRLTRSTAPRPRPGIVHLGPGAFFRAFIATYTDDAMAASGEHDWGIVAASLRSAEARDALLPQGGAFHSVTLAPDGETCRVIESIVDARVLPEEPEAVLTRLVDPAIRVVTLTITEKGYCHAPADGRLRLDHPDIVHDLAVAASGDAPRSAPGLLVEALARRRAAGIAPFTVLSCDNLPSNGRLTRAVLLEFAAARERSGARAGDAGLHDWIAQRLRCPSSMVDRITPATTQADIDRIACATGVHDAACVLHEPFRQWVIEDDFPTGRPAWEAAGAQLVGSVERHETMKLRCLNGSHSALAYLGYLAGHETIADAVAEADIAGFCSALWREEILPTVAAPEGEDPEAYCAALLARFRNPAVRHRTWQIAMDGSQKLPQRLLGTVADNLAAGRELPRLALAIAAWMRYVGGIDERGDAIDVRDPLAERLRAVHEAHVEQADRVRALLAVRDVFAPELAAEPRFVDAVSGAYAALARDGAAACVRRLA